MTKKCSKCHNFLEVSNFYFHRGTYDGLLSWCKDCHRLETKKWKLNNKDKVKHTNKIYRENNRNRRCLYNQNYEVTHKKERYEYRLRYLEKTKNTRKEYNKQWRLKNKQLVAFYTRTYNAKKLQRTPKWADLEAIKQFYLDCPKGHEVDHIIPLQGKFVSGLHVIENLQYLTRSENRKKSNKILGEI